MQPASATCGSRRRSLASSGCIALREGQEMKLTNQVEEARELLEESIVRMDDQDAKIQALHDDTDDTEVEFQRALFEKFEADVKRRTETVERLIAIQRAREAIPPAEDDEGDGGDDDEAKDARKRILVGK